MADDDKDDFNVLVESAELLEGTALEFSYASNWMAMQRNLKKKQPDVIFLDLNMPIKDGFECLISLRQDHVYKEIPIIIYSTSTSKADIDKAHRLGANYFVIKPDTHEKVATLLKRITAMTEQELQSKQAREKFVIA